MLELIGNGRRDRRDSAAHWLELGQVWGNVSALMLPSFTKMRRGGGDARKNKELPDTEIRAGRRKGRPGSRQKSGTSSAFFTVTHDSPLDCDGKPERHAQCFGRGGCE